VSGRGRYQTWADRKGDWAAFDEPNGGQPAGLTDRPSSSRRRSTGPADLRPAFETREDLDRSAERLERLDVERSEAIDVPPGAILNIKDPEGIALALMSRR
jgi:hypothetical protein